MLRACTSTLPAYGERIPGCGNPLVYIPGGGFVCPTCDGGAAAAILTKEKP